MDNRVSTLDKSLLIAFLHSSWVHTHTPTNNDCPFIEPNKCFVPLDALHLAFGQYCKKQTGVALDVKCNSFKELILSLGYTATWCFSVVWPPSSLVISRQTPATSTRHATLLQDITLTHTYYKEIDPRQEQAIEQPIEQIMPLPDHKTIEQIAPQPEVELEIPIAKVDLEIQPVSKCKISSKQTRSLFPLIQKRKPVLLFATPDAKIDLPVDPDQKRKAYFPLPHTSFLYEVESQAIDSYHMKPLHNTAAPAPTDAALDRRAMFVDRKKYHPRRSSLPDTMFF